jgi:1-acyl-sn-glycerol-3-phosphate acyltransferase
MKKIIYKIIFFRIMGWRIVGAMNPEIKKSVIIVVPHTSWHDFYIGLLVRGIIDLEMNYVAKKELFRFPFGYYFRWMGGTPLNRNSRKNTVDVIASIFEKRAIFRLAIAPEGTRKKVSDWKTGFYYIALKAEVTIIPVAFNWIKKEVVIYETFNPTGNVKIDFHSLKRNFKGVIGKVASDSFDF